MAPGAARGYTARMKKALAAGLILFIAAHAQAGSRARRVGAARVQPGHRSQAQHAPAASGAAAQNVQYNGGPSSVSQVGAGFGRSIGAGGGGFASGRNFAAGGARSSRGSWGAFTRSLGPQYRRADDGGAPTTEEGPRYVSGQLIRSEGLGFTYQQPPQGQRLHEVDAGSRIDLEPQKAFATTNINYVYTDKPDKLPGTGGLNGPAGGASGRTGISDR